MKINFSIEDIVSALNVTKEQKEEIYIRMGNFNSEDGSVIWEGDKIRGFKPYQSINYIDLNIMVTKDGIEILKSKS